MPPSLPPIIDTHQHLWDPEQLDLPWLKNAGPPLAGRHWAEEYRTATEGVPIAASIYMEVDADPAQKLKEADLVLKLIESDSSPTKGAILSANPGADGFRKFVDRFRNDDRVKGYRQVLHGGTTPAGYCLSEKFMANCRYLGSQGKTFDLCLRTPELRDAVRLAAACPETTFVIDHCGNADPKAFFTKDDTRNVRPSHDAQRWRDDMIELAHQPNLHCKISGIVARVPDEWSADDLRPIVEHCRETFGESRIVFGSDWPVCKMGASLKEWVAALAEIIAPWPRDAQQKLLSENARKIYHLA
ncbi:amidohydrolase family protein [Bremerella sp. JC817]|uniref:amidohydrolase family protein n=1 Tax=Bremerella sp. JC817 TaxID=3231756 RepID=UPI00345A3C75